MYPADRFLSRKRIEEIRLSGHPFPDELQALYDAALLVADVHHYKNADLLDAIHEAISWEKTSDKGEPLEIDINLNEEKVIIAIASFMASIYAQKMKDLSGRLAGLTEKPADSAAA